MSDSKYPTLEKWQFDLIKRLPASPETIEKILKEEFSVDFEGNQIKERQVVQVKRKRKKSITCSETDTDIVLSDASIQ